jgi:hypothetical protein
MPQKIDAKKLQAEVQKAGGRWQAGVTSVSELPDDEKLLRLGYTPGPNEPSLEQRERSQALSILRLAGRLRRLALRPAMTYEMWPARTSSPA